jgi:hypothetical protein
MILFISHIIACIWLLVGTIEKENNIDNWMDKLGI